MAESTAFYTKQQSTYVIKLVGDIRYTMGCTLDEFINQLFLSSDFTGILLDLREVTAIDSTVLGLLAKIANFARDRFASKVTLVSSNQDINQMLESVGFFQIFNVCDTCPIQVETLQPIPCKDLSKPELTKTLLEAHSTLSQLNDKNKEAFQGVIDALKPKVVDETAINENSRSDV